MKTLGTLLLAALVTLTFSGCGSSSDSPATAGSGTNNNQENATYNPSGKFGYDFQSTFNGRVCDAGDKEFTQFADYCHALADNSQNQDPQSHKVCAEEDRKDLFSKDCAPHGYVWPVNASTPTPTPASIVAPTPVPSSSPGVNPTPYPSPIDTSQAVIVDLEQKGFKVKIDNEIIQPLPGELSFKEKLNRFLVILANHEDLVVARKNVIQEINLSSYTAYLSKYQDLVLGVDLSESDFVAYFGLFDRRIALERNVGINLDLGVEENQYGEMGVFEQTIKFLEANQTALQAINHLVKNLVKDNNTGYTLFNQTLKVNSTNFQSDLIRFASQYSFANAFFKWADQKNISVTGDIHVTDDASVFKSVLDQLTTKQSELLFLKNKNVIDTIDIKDADIPFLNESLHSFQVSSRGVGFSSNADMIAAAAYEKQIEDTMKLNVGSDIKPSEYLKYLIAINRMHQFESVIREKSKFLKTLTFTVNSSYYPGALQVGYQDSDAAFSQILNQIH